jgi:hypothetical protein
MSFIADMTIGARIEIHSHFPTGARNRTPVLTRL